MAVFLNERDWQLRLHLYRFIVDHNRPPTATEAAIAFNMSEDDVRASYQRLHDTHVIFLEPGTASVRMAHPLSAVQTPYRVSVYGRVLYANCAWV